MKKILFTILGMAAMTAYAQETYENANLLKPELNGTARYIGMGGAMEALGADISTINTNPAGIGLFRSSSVNLSFGLSSQQDVTTYGSDHKTVPSFDQAGFVYSMRTNSKSFVNFAFNYSKSRNFNQILNAAGRLNGSSQNTLTYNKLAAGGEDFVYFDKDGTILSDYIQFSQLDYLYANNINYERADKTFYYNKGDAYDMYRAQSGYIGRYDFNVSGNVNDRFYWGVTVGVHDVHYNGFSSYIEALYDDNNDGIKEVEVSDTREITGNGVDVKAGVIFRPVAESPFRIGLSVSTPTWYDLRTSNYTNMFVNGSQGKFAPEIGETYEFKLYTPWKFGASLGHTIGNNLALGVSYEYADYGTTDTRVKDGYDYYGNEQSYSERAMNEHTKNTLKGVSTLKVGAEFKPDPAIAVRMGFNYVSPMYSKSGVKDGTLDSYGVFYQSMSDFTNWEDTYRLTAGLGYNIGKFNIDLAYQYSATNGKFSPFYDCADYINEDYNVSNNTFEVCKVSDKRHQLMLTLGYRF